MTRSATPGGAAGEAELLRLAERHCGGLLDAREAIRLEHLIAEDIRLAQVFIEYCGVHASLNCRLRADGPGLPDFTTPRSRRRVGVLPGVLAAAAAVAVLVAFAAVRMAEPAGATPIAELASVSVDAVFAGEAPSAGTRLGAGAGLDLLDGWARIEVGRGVKIDLEGPASLTILSGDRLRLERGRLSASVPPHAVGFEILTADVSVVDLGTEFYVVREPGAGTQVQVLTGRVATRPLAVDGTPGVETLLASGEAARFDLVGGFAGLIEPLAEVADWLARRRLAVAGAARLEGAARSLPFVPADLSVGGLETVNHVAVIPEAEAVTLAEPLTVETIFGPRRLAAGVPYDSVLIHHEATDLTRRLPIGRVAFEAAVAAVVTDSAALAATDAAFGLAATRYPSSPVRGLVPGEDRVEVAPDRTAVRFRFDLSPPAMLDQIRVIVPSVGAQPK